MEKVIGEKVCVCFIDDDPMFQEICKYFAKKGHPAVEITTFLEGPMALEHWENHDHFLPNYILLDVNMGAYKAWEFLVAFESLTRQDTPEVKIVVLSSHYSQKEKEKVIGFKNVIGYYSKDVVDPEFFGGLLSG